MNWEHSIQTVACLSMCKGALLVCICFFEILTQLLPLTGLCLEPGRGSHSVALPRTPAESRYASFCVMSLSPIVDSGA